MIEEIVGHVVIVGLGVVMPDRVVLIEVESDYALEGKAFLLMESDQLSVN